MFENYIVRLTDGERSICEDIVNGYSSASPKALRARILLHIDVDGPDGWTDREISKACRCRIGTVATVRKRCVLEGFTRALDSKRRATPPAPPGDYAEVVPAMEEALATYARPYDPQRPVLCMAEESVPLVRKVRMPVGATARRVFRDDYEYERAGMAALFVFMEPRADWRRVMARHRETEADWAEEVAALLEGRYANCESVTLVCDKRSTYKKGAFFKVFEPARARELARLIEFRHTPKCDSWLNIAECELSALRGNCKAGWRVGDLAELRRRVGA